MPAQGQEVLPEVKLRSPVSPKEGGPLRVRLKASEPSQARHGRQLRQHTAQGRGQGSLPKISVRVGGASRQGGPEAGSPSAKAAQRSQSLRVKFRVNSEGGLPQVDGAADSDIDSAIAGNHNEGVPAGLISSVDVQQQEPKQSNIAADPSVPIQDRAACDPADAAKPACNPGPVQTEPPDAPHSKGSDAMPHAEDAGTLPELHASPAAARNAAADASQPEEAVPAISAPSAVKAASHAPQSLQTGHKPESHIDGEAATAKEPNGQHGQALKGRSGVDAEGDVDEALKHRQGSASEVDAAALETELAGTPASPGAGRPPGLEPDQNRPGCEGLTDAELAALPLLASALREWLDVQTSHIPGVGDSEAAQVKPSPDNPRVPVPCRNVHAWLTECMLLTHHDSCGELEIAAMPHEVAMLPYRTPWTGWRCVCERCRSQSAPSGMAWPLVACPAFPYPARSLPRSMQRLRAARTAERRSMVCPAPTRRMTWRPRSSATPRMRRRTEVGFAEQAHEAHVSHGADHIQLLISCLVLATRGP